MKGYDLIPILLDTFKLKLKAFIFVAKRGFVS